MNSLDMCTSLTSARLFHTHGTDSFSLLKPWWADDWRWGVVVDQLFPRREFPTRMSSLMDTGVNSLRGSSTHTSRVVFLTGVSSLVSSEVEFQTK